jgi:hypothetical protein
VTLTRPLVDPPTTRGSSDDGLEPPSGYIRGGAGVSTDSRHVLRAVVGFCLASLAILALALTVAAVHQNSRNDRLQHHGVAVDLTVTSCLGQATGTGITENAFVCRGSFELNGHRYNEVIGGSTRLLAPGETVQAIADPRSPSTVSTVEAVRASPAKSRPYVLAAIPALLFVMIAGLVFWWSRRQTKGG